MSLISKIIILLILSFSVSRAMNDSLKNSGHDSLNPEISMSDIQAKYTDSLMTIPGVEGIGIGKSGQEDCFIIYISRITKENRKKIPAKLDGYPVKIEKTGKFKPMNK
jgi:hypothetical protein